MLKKYQFTYAEKYFSLLLFQSINFLTCAAP